MPSLRAPLPAGAKFSTFPEACCSVFIRRASFVRAFAGSRLGFRRRLAIIAKFQRSGVMLDEILLAQSEHA
jgi:hypothetical protein